MSLNWNRRIGRIACNAAAIGALSGIMSVSIHAQPNAANTTEPARNWRVVETLKAGRFAAAVEISSTRTLRVLAAVDNARLVSSELPIDSTNAWDERVFNQLDAPMSREYVLGNALLVQPFLGDGGKIGYLVTIADTVGASRAVIMDKGTMENLLDMLESGVVAAKTLSDAELRRSGPVASTPVALAKHYTTVYPRTARLAGVSGSALLQFVVDTLGHVRPATITTVDATYKDFSDEARSALLDMEFTPATMEGHKIERMVQIPFNFNLHADLPISAFSVPVRRTR